MPAIAQTASDLVPIRPRLIDARLLRLCIWSVGLGLAAAIAAQVLVRLIAFVTNFAFFLRFSLEEISPAENQLGLWVVVPPIIGALLVGYMARYGSPAIRGHGIPEAMEQVLTNESRIPARMTWLKPLSAAVSIGTGGPFGAEGPIIATGGSLGSLLGQLTRVTASERKTLLAAGAAAGMSATFGSPVSAVLLAIELLLFEFRPRSLIPVVLASITANSIRIVIEGVEPVFGMPDIIRPTGAALVTYVLLGALMGIAAAGMTRLLYWIEDGFERLPIHWMWWPAVGAVAVGVIGYFSPRTLGVGYSNIGDLLSNQFVFSAALFLCVTKFASWSIALGSGTSGGTLAPIFTIGAALGLVLGQTLNDFFPQAGIDPRVAALVGMASLFAGASRALLTSAVFAFETTLQPLGLLPLLGGCAMSYLVASSLSRYSIMTEKIARRGVIAPNEYLADHLDQVLVEDIASPEVVVLRESQTIAAARHWIAEEFTERNHQGFPVLDDRGRLVGVVTRRNFMECDCSPEDTIGSLVRRMPVYVYSDCTVREAADHMVRHGVGRLPVVRREDPRQLAGIITRSDILSVYERRLKESTPAAPTAWPRGRKRAIA